MIITEKIPKSQFVILFLCLLIFFVSAVFGWNKLNYGFNFIDEGYHAAESWRLASGDNFLQDKITGALMHYTLISSLIFKIYPDVSLLQLRQLQFIMTLVSLLIFSGVLFRQGIQYSWLPFVFSLFAFTGLDATGMISNLYYQTYPHLFLVVYLSFLLLGLNSEKPVSKKTFYLFSGFCLWAMSLSLLYLGLIILSPVLFFIILRGSRSKFYSFNFRELLFVLLPFAGCWLIFIAIFNMSYLINLLASLNVILSISAYSTKLIHINWELIKHITISIVFLLMFFGLINKLSITYSIPGCAILSASMLLIINTSLFGYIEPYYNGWLSKPMWFSSLLLGFTFLFWAYILSKLIFKMVFSREEMLSIALMIPFTICSMTMSLFSGLGSLSVSQSSIPAVAAIAYMYASKVKKNKYEVPVSALFIVLLLCPFYFSTAKNDWNFTYFDVLPEQANVEIENGFGRGIYTNKLYSSLYDWLNANAIAYTRPGEYAISYVVSPMVHMITKRRPSLDDTFITFAKPNSYYEKAIEKMKQRGREPKIAFVFERMPCLFPVSLEKGTFAWPGKQYDFQFSQDPITSYIKDHMKFVSEFKISDDNIIRCFVDSHSILN